MAPTTPSRSRITGWPDRLYVIDCQGTIVYKSKPGPFGFHLNEVQETLERLD